MAMPAVTEPRRVDVEADVLVGIFGLEKSIWAITSSRTRLDIRGRKMIRS